MGLGQRNLEGLPLSASILGVCENSLGNFALMSLEKVIGAASTLASQRSKEAELRRESGPVRGGADAVGGAFKGVGSKIDKGLNAPFRDQ